MNKSFLTGAVYLDLHKAVDTVDPEIMLLKLSWVGVRGAALEWFSNYLNERMQKVSNKGVLSDALPKSNGMPQGSILGPLLFILFINDLPKCITNCTISLYADDTVLLFSAKISEEIRVNIQEDLDRAIKLFKENRLHLNVKKTKWSLLGTYQKINKAVDITINVGNSPLEQVSEYKYLGMWIDKNLNWNYHVDKMCSKLSRRHRILRRVKFNLPKETLYMLYNSIVLLLFDYGDVVY